MLKAVESLGKDDVEKVLSEIGKDFHLTLRKMVTEKMAFHDRKSRSQMRILL